VNLCATESTDQAASTEPPEKTPPASAVPSRRAALSVEDLLLDEATLVNSPALPYVLMVASVLECRTVTREELLAALRESVRQRRIGLRARRDYVLRYLNQHPP
jgi:hypothetical protein